jgi:prepilin-type N-terminal cleavage/methylation domain-containing protein
MTHFRSQAGFTLVELLVATILLMLVSVGFYQVMFSGTRNSRTAESLAAVSQEARVGLNRLLRETREATKLIAADGNSYKIEVDPDGEGSGTPYYVTFRRDGDTLYMKLQVSTSDPGIEEVLIEGITPQAGSTDVFSYSSHLLQYDVLPSPSGDGTVTWQDLDAAACTPHLPPPGKCDNLLGQEELDNLSRVDYAFDIREGDAEAQFVAEAHIRAAWRDP